MTAGTIRTKPGKEISFWDGYGLLMKEVEKGKPAPPVKDGTLPLSAIRWATSVFQPRTGRGQFGASDGHVAALAGALRDRKNQLLDPVLVWWSGVHWRLVDGHHRLDAYQQVCDPKQAITCRLAIVNIPVEVFSGTLDSAVIEATRRNVKDKLPMTKFDKLERAWRFVGMERYSIRQIVETTGIAERTVSNMRKAASELQIIGTDFVTTTGPRPLDMTWSDAKKRMNGTPSGDWEDTKMDKLATEYARRLGKAFGKKLSDNPTLAWRAYEMYSENMARRIEEWLKEGWEHDDSEEDDDDEATTRPSPNLTSNVGVNSDDTSKF